MKTFIFIILLSSLLISCNNKIESEHKKLSKKYDKQVKQNSELKEEFNRLKIKYKYLENNLTNELTKKEELYNNHFLNYIISNNLEKNDYKLNPIIWISFKLKLDNFIVDRVKFNEEKVKFKVKNNLVILPIKFITLKDIYNISIIGKNSNKKDIIKNYKCKFNKILYSMECNENKKIQF